MEEKRCIRPARNLVQSAASAAITIPTVPIGNVGIYAANFNGTFDMGGNVCEWNEAIINGGL